MLERAIFPVPVPLLIAALGPVTGVGPGEAAVVLQAHELVAEFVLLGEGEVLGVRGGLQAVVLGHVVGVLPVKCEGKYFKQQEKSQKIVVTQ